MRLLLIFSSFFCLFLPLHADSQSQTISSPLTQTEILGRLALGDPPSYVGHLVKIRGLFFSVTPDFLRRVREAGGAGILIQRLAAAEVPRSTAPPSEPALEHLTQCAAAQHVADFEQAATECRASNDENPQSPWPILAALEEHGKEDFSSEERLLLIHRAVALGPNVHWAHTLLAIYTSDEAEKRAEYAKASSLLPGEEFLFMDLFPVAELWQRQTSQFQITKRR